MYEGFKAGQLKVVVGVRFDRQMERLIAFTRNFAEKTQSKIRLTYALDYGREHAWVSSYYGNPYYLPIARDLKEVERKDAEERLRNLAKSFPKDVSVETHMAEGSPADVLSADAIAANASMILVGTRVDRSAFIPKGFSTSLTLMSQASCPVMAVPEDAELFPTDRRLRLIYADDLSPHSQEALNLAVEMSYGFGHLDFYHVHFCSSTQEEIEKIGDRLLELMQVHAVPFEEEWLEGSFFARTENKIKAKMEGRLGTAKMMFALSQSSYYQEVIFGSDIKKELQEAVAKINPDLLIFGRHAMVHRKPFSIGRLPFSAMLSQKKPIIISPTAKTFLGG